MIEKLLNNRAFRIYRASPAPADMTGEPPRHLRELDDDLVYVERDTFVVLTDDADIVAAYRLNGFTLVEATADEMLKVRRKMMPENAKPVNDGSIAA